MDNFRTLSKTVKQSDSDTSRHTLICGESGTGMSVYLSYLMRQDIAKGNRIILIDPWGDLVNEVKKFAGEKADIIDLSKESVKGLCDIFHANSPQEYNRVAQGVVNLFVQIYDPNHTGIVGPRFEFAVYNVVMALLYAGNPSFVNMHKAMVDQSFLQSLLTHVPDGPVRQYWTQQISQTSDFHKSEILDYVVSKFGVFMQEGPIKNIFESGKDHHDLVALMKTKQILLLDTSVIRTSRAIATIVYTALGTKLLELTQSNEDPKSIYIDEVNMFAGSETVMQAFEEGRRSKTEFTVTTRDLEYMPAVLRSKILRFGTIVAFRQAVKDGQILAEHFLDEAITGHSLATQKKYSFSLRYLDAGEIKVSTGNTIDLSE
jgi:hypothetical protein